MTSDRDDSDDGRVTALRSAMVAELRDVGSIHCERVLDAFRVVPRHLFAPGVPLEDVYATAEAVVTKRNEHGVPVSSVSAPSIQAAMLVQADVRPGMNVLEIGSGGCNAALLAELVGPDGGVTSVDIDAEVTERARAFLGAAGYSRVEVVLADAEFGVPQRAPYDRILVTVGAWDVPPAWVDQLVGGGRLVVPLRMRGLSRSLALDRVGRHLVSRSVVLCGFVAMRGIGAYAERLVRVGQDVGLRLDEDTGPADPARFDGLLDTDRAEAWTGVTLEYREPFDTLQLWLATSMPGLCRFVGRGDGLVDEGNRWFGLAAVVEDSLAYLVARPARQGVAEFGAHAFGPRAAGAAEAMAEQIRVWDRDQRGGPGPTFAVFGRDTPDESLPAGAVIDKRHTRVVISWPTPTTYLAR